MGDTIVNDLRIHGINREGGSVGKGIGKTKRRDRSALALLKMETELQALRFQLLGIILSMGLSWCKS